MPEEMVLFILTRVSALKLHWTVQELYHVWVTMTNENETSKKQKIKNVQAVVTIIACIFIKVISNVEASIVVWSVLKIN